MRWDINNPTGFNRCNYYRFFCDVNRNFSSGRIFHSVAAGSYNKVNLSYFCLIRHSNQTIFIHSDAGMRFPQLPCNPFACHLNIILVQYLCSIGCGTAYGKGIFGNFFIALENFDRRRYRSIRAISFIRQSQNFRTPS